MENSNRKTMEIINNIISNATDVKRGTNKECYLYLKYALLKHTCSVGLANFKRYFFEETSKLNKMLVESGVNTPKIYKLGFANGNLYELQSLAEGTPLFVFNEENAIKKFLGKDVKPEEPEKLKLLSNAELNELAVKACRFNLDILKTLKKAPQEHFNKLLSDMLLCSNVFGIDFADNNSENFIYSNNSGFSLIDVEYEEAIYPLITNAEKLERYKKTYVGAIASKKKYVKKPANAINYGICESFIEIFTECVPFALDGETKVLKVPARNQINAVYQNVIPVLEKAVRTIAVNKQCFTAKQAQSFFNKLQKFEKISEFSKVYEAMDEIKVVKENKIKK